MMTCVVLIYMKQTFGLVDFVMLGILVLTKRLWLLPFFVLLGICHQLLLAFGQVEDEAGFGETWQEPVGVKARTQRQLHAPNLFDTQNVFPRSLHRGLPFEPNTSQFQLTSVLSGDQLGYEKDWEKYRVLRLVIYPARKLGSEGLSLGSHSDASMVNQTHLERLNHVVRSSRRSLVLGAPSMPQGPERTNLVSVAGGSLRASVGGEDDVAA
ncbi:hypothetical protein V8G54_026012 [Vigna mungo]|uniref:Uncharacterized protein n=1 Tax=Vigna mungo TaxID=3915 RepID=A0AAQ3RP25_VIGMU